MKIPPYPPNRIGDEYILKAGPTRLTCASLIDASCDPKTDKEIITGRYGSLKNDLPKGENGIVPLLYIARGLDRSRPPDVVDCDNPLLLMATRDVVEYTEKFPYPDEFCCGVLKDLAFTSSILVNEKLPLRIFEGIIRHASARTSRGQYCMDMRYVAEHVLLCATSGSEKDINKANELQQEALEKMMTSVYALSKYERVFALVEISRFAKGELQAQADEYFLSEAESLRGPALESACFTAYARGGPQLRAIARKWIEEDMPDNLMLQPKTPQYPASASCIKESCVIS